MAAAAAPTSHAASNARPSIAATVPANSNALLAASGVPRTPASTTTLGRDRRVIHDFEFRVRDGQLAEAMQFGAEVAEFGRHARSLLGRVT